MVPKKKKIKIKFAPTYLSDGPLDERATCFAGPVDGLVVVVGVTQELCLHVMTDVLTTGGGRIM